MTTALRVLLLLLWQRVQTYTSLIMVAKALRKLCVDWLGQTLAKHWLLCFDADNL